jgi:hypothetical protein
MNVTTVALHQIKIGSNDADRRVLSLHHRLVDAAASRGQNGDEKKDENHRASRKERDANNRWTAFEKVVGSIHKLR